MADLSIRRGGSREVFAGSSWEPLRALDPLRMMRELFNMDPFAGMVVPGATAFAPEIEIKETKDAFAINVDLPGVREQDVEVSIAGDRITVSGKREEEERREDDRYFAYERSYGAFSRSFALPPSADPERTKAALKDGVLHIEVPKRTEMQARKVPIGGGEKAQEPEREKKAGGEPERKKAA